MATAVTLCFLVYSFWLLLAVSHVFFILRALVAVNPHHLPPSPLQPRLGSSTGEYWGLVIPALAVYAFCCAAVGRAGLAMVLQ